MRSNSKHTTIELERYIYLYVNEGISYRELCKEYGLLLGAARFNDKVLRYQDHGLEGNATIKGLARKYNIPSDRTVRN